MGTRTDAKVLANIMWRIADGIRGVYPLGRIAEVAPFCAYAALLAQGADDGKPIDLVLSEAQIDPRVRQLILSYWGEKMEGLARLLARQVEPDYLRDFILHYDFSSDGGKYSGRNGTPGCINKLVLAILAVDSNERTADLGCGRGDFFVELAERQPSAELYGIDVNVDAVCLARIRMSLLGNNAQIVEDDMLSAKLDGPFDKIFSNYPLGMRSLGMRSGVMLRGEGKYYEAYRNGEIGFRRPSSDDWVFNKVICDSLAYDGLAVAIMTSGAAFNGGDKLARKYFIDKGLIKAVVALPGNLFRYTAIPTTLIVLGRNDGPVRLVDASDLSASGRRWDIIGDDEISAILDRLTNDGEYSRLVSKEELAANEYNLFPSRYLGRNIELENSKLLGDLVLSIERGSALTAKDLDVLTVDEDTGLSYLRLSDITDGGISDNLPHLRELDPKTERQWLRTGDLIVSKNGAPFRIAVAEIPEGQTIMASGNLYIIRLDTDIIDPYFAAAFLASEDGRELIDRMVVGTVIPSLPLRNLKGIQMPVPDKGVQEAVSRQYRSRLDEIKVLKKKLRKARISAASVYDEMAGR